MYIICIIFFIYAFLFSLLYSYTYFLLFISIFLFKAFVPLFLCVSVDILDIKYK